MADVLIVEIECISKGKKKSHPYVSAVTMEKTIELGHLAILLDTQKFCP